jgi:hypothetical protein
MEIINRTKRKSSLKRPKSVLARQTPKKRKRSKTTLTLISVIFLLAFGYFFNNEISDYLSRQYGLIYQTKIAKLKNTPWTFHLHPKNLQNLSEQEKNDVLEYLVTTSKGKNVISLGDIAETLSKKKEFSYVHILQNSSQHATIYIEKHKAIAAILADRWRLLSQDRKVFGRYDDQENRFLKITGIFSDRQSDFSANLDHSLVVTRTEQNRIDHAMALFNQAKRMSIGLVEIEYKPYRGYFVTLEEDLTKVAIGQAPFDDSLLKLDEILKELKKKNISTSLIELDYQGKAFIKKKKPS